MNIMKYFISLLIIFFIILISSCLTTGQAEYYSTYSFSSGEDPIEISIDSPVELPRVELFVSAPYMGIQEEILLSDVNIKIPEEIVSDVSEEEPVVSVYSALEPAVRSPEPSVGPVLVANVDKQEEPQKHSVTVPESLPEEEIKSQSEEAIVKEKDFPVSESKRSLTVPTREDFNINLEKEGWIFDREKSSPNVVLKSREFSNGETRFTFSSEGDDAIIILFLLQNSSTGKDEQIVYNVKKSERKESDIPVIIDAQNNENEDVVQQSGDPDLRNAVAQGNIPGIVASIDNLTNLLEDPGVDLIYDVFNLLQQQGGYDQSLVELAENSFNRYPYDNSTVEMLFRAAEFLEKPGEGQDIEKAVTLFKLVRDNYPLSVYSDRSEERISFLERHFMKIY